MGGRQHPKCQEHEVIVILSSQSQKQYALSGLYPEKMIDSRVKRIIECCKDQKILKLSQKIDELKRAQAKKKWNHNKKSN